MAGRWSAFEGRIGCGVVYVRKREMEEERLIGREVESDDGRRERVW
jgi:hypothetical protein